MVCIVKATVFPVVMYGCESWTIKKAKHQRVDAFECGAGEDCWQSLGLQGDPTSPSQRKSVLNIHWKDWCWSWSSSTKPPDGKSWLWKRPWCWERLKAGGVGDGRGWDSWMASPTWWTWVWASSRSWWWTRKAGVLQSMGSQSQTWLSDWTE